jgi:hypothetical protein
VSQVLLGVRNLSVRIAIFVVLAALLVWFLGGSLFPRADEVVRGTVDVGRAGEGLASVRLVEIIHPLSTLPSERVTFAVEVAGEGVAAALGGGFVRCETLPVLVEAGSLVSVADATAFRTAYFAARRSGTADWSVFALGGYEACPRELHAYSDRFEAERQIARAGAGLSIQDPATAAAARDGALRAGDAVGRPPEAPGTPGLPPTR